MIILESLWDQFAILLESCKDLFGIIIGSLCDHQELVIPSALVCVRVYPCVFLRIAYFGCLLWMTAVFYKFWKVCQNFVSLDYDAQKLHMTLLKVRLQFHEPKKMVISLNQVIQKV